MLAGTGPRALMLQGRGGVGKTTLIKTLCSRLGLDLYVSNGAEFGNEFEGAPVKRRKEVQADTLAIRRARGQETNGIAWLIDDIHLSPMCARDTENTVNRVLHAGDWQFICDQPVVVDADGLAVPIFATGNSFGQGILETLFRPSRATFITLDPSPAEKRHMIAAVLGIEHRPADDVEAFLARHEHQPMAFFKQLKAQALDDTLARLYAAHQFDMAAIDAGIVAARQALTLADLDAVATRLAAATGEDFLAEWR